MHTHTHCVVMHYLQQLHIYVLLVIVFSFCCCCCFCFLLHFFVSFFCRFKICVKGNKQERKRARESEYIVAVAVAVGGFLNSCDHCLSFFTNSML